MSLPSAPAVGPVPHVPPPMQTPLRIGLLGLGTVGRGTWQVLARNGATIAARAGRRIEVALVAVRDVARARALVGPPAEVLDDPFAVVRHPGIAVVVEAIGGCTVARELVLAAIANGKHVVTANKALLALHGAEIFAAARARGVIVAFEGAVAVSIPIVKALREGLTANRVEWLAGIVNGTSNHVLTEMRDKGVSFDAALREAQRLGYAEADPSFDVDGIDAAHKLALLAGMAFGAEVDFAAIHVEGIRAVQAVDHAHAARLGLRLKLLAIARQRAEGLELRVHPALVPARALLAQVDGAMNGIVVHADAAGPTFLYGAGAGSEQTASAVIADLVDVARLERTAPHQRVAPLGFHGAAVPLPVLPIGAVRCRHYLRVPAADAPALLRAALDTLAAHGIAADAHLADEDALVITTLEAPEPAARAAATALAALPGARGAAVRLRIESLA